MWFRNPRAYAHQPRPIDQSPGSEPVIAEDDDMSYWTKVCHVCRTWVFQRPARVYNFAAIIKPLGLTSRHTAEHESTDANTGAVAEATQKSDPDDDNRHDLWANIFPPPQKAYKCFDADDAIFRCPECGNEVDGDTCTGCDAIFSDADDSDASSHGFMGSPDSEGIVIPGQSRRWHAYLAREQVRESREYRDQFQRYRNGLDADLMPDDNEPPPPMEGDVNSDEERQNELDALHDAYRQTYQDEADEEAEEEARRLDEPDRRNEGRERESEQGIPADQILRMHGLLVRRNPQGVYSLLRPLTSEANHGPDVDDEEESGSEEGYEASFIDDEEHSADTLDSWSFSSLDEESLDADGTADADADADEGSDQGELSLSELRRRRLQSLEG